MPGREILFLALTRPALVWGVPLEGLALNVFGCFTAGLYLQAPTIWRSPVMFWAAVIPIHFAMRFFTSWDYWWPRTLRLWALKAAYHTLPSLPTMPARRSEEMASSV